MFKLVLEKAEEPEIKLPTIWSVVCWIIGRAREFQKNIYFCFIDYAGAFDCVHHNKLWEVLEGMGIPDHLACLFRACMQVEKRQLGLDMEQHTGSKWEKEYIKDVCCRPAYLTYMQSTSCKMLCWMKPKLKSRLPGEISVASDMQMVCHDIPFLLFVWSVISFINVLYFSK